MELCEAGGEAGPGDAEFTAILEGETCTTETYQLAPVPKPVGAKVRSRMVNALAN